MGSTPSVLIADNNDFYLQSIGDLYRELGFEVRTARDGMEALQRIRQRRPDLLVLDLIMPRIDGAQLCALIKARPELSPVKVIILSGILADEIQDVESIRADAYVAKMPLAQIAAALKAISSDLLGGASSDAPLIYGFEKMYRREVVLELLQQRRTQRAILDSLSEGIVELSEDGRLLAVNDPFERIAGRSESDLLSLTLEEVLPGASAEVASLFQTLASGSSLAASEAAHRGRDLFLKLHRLAAEEDEDRPLRQAMKEAAGQGLARAPARRPGFTLLVEDVTDKVKAERDREALRARLAQSEKLSAIGLLVSGLAHELNNPLTSVFGYAQLLRQRHPDARMQADLGQIVEGARRCRTIVEELMSFARGVRPRKEPLDLNAVVLDVTASHRDALSAAGARLSLDLAPRLGEVMADRALIAQALDHVLDNAVKALAEARGGRLVTIATFEREDRAVIEVADNGPGIPEELLGKVFQPFFTTRRVGQGAGLGLSAAYGIVRAHSGSLTASSRPGGGAVLRLGLPLAGAGQHESGPAGESEEALPRGCRVLIVDAETVVVELLADFFEGMVERIDTAATGHEGLRKARTASYDLILADVGMPDLPGERFWRELAAERPEAMNRLLFLSSGEPPAERRAFLEATGAACLMKPFSLEQLASRVRAILRKTETGRAV
ncbi:MAG TPA: response regulator [Candidatus Polarisedimenticolia bacterium]|nr:response regulator [Candidatus Polarisedimenticolia bacterium]